MLKFDSNGIDEYENVYESLPKIYDPTVHLLAGAMAGIMEHSIMYPIDSVKTRMQSLNPYPKAVYRSVPEALWKMMRYEGTLRPIRGLTVMVAGAGPAHALYFSCYELMKRVLSGTDTGGRNPIAQGTAGCFATILHDAVMNPAEVIKQRLQMFNSPYTNAYNCAFNIWRKEGIRAFYRSYLTQVTMNIPFQSSHLITYEFMQELTNPERIYNPTTHVISGAVAGSIAGAITTPLDVCKTLLNTQDARTLSASRQSQIRGLIHAAHTIYSCCGFKGFFNGLQARVMYTLPSTTICWSVYEFFKHVYDLKL